MPKRNGQPTKTDRLLSDPKVKLWYTNLWNGSHNTAKTWIQRLGTYCDLNKLPYETGPNSLLHLKKSKTACANANFEMLCATRDKMQRIIKPDGTPYPSDYIRGILGTVRHLLNENGIVITRRIKVDGRNDPPPNTKTPNPIEMYAIFSAASPRVKVSSGLIGYAGLRPESLGDEGGYDGIRLGDIPDLELLPEPHFTHSLPKLIVRRPVSKNKRQYYTLIIKRLQDAIIDYLKIRIEGGENLTKDTPLIKPTARKTNGGRFITTRNISEEIRTVIRKCKYDFTPYELRSHFESQMQIAINNREINAIYVKFLMGHVGDIEQAYSTNRHHLSDDLERDIRISFGKASSYLIEIVNPTEIRQQVAEHVRKEFAEENMQLRIEALETKDKMRQYERDAEKWRQHQEQTERKILEILARKGLITVEELRSEMEQ